MLFPKMMNCYHFAFFWIGLSWAGQVLVQDMMDDVEYHTTDPQQETFHEYVWRKQQYCGLLPRNSGYDDQSKMVQNCRIFEDRLDMIQRWDLRGEFQKQRAVKEGIFPILAYELMKLKDINSRIYYQIMTDMVKPAIVQLDLVVYVEDADNAEIVDFIRQVKRRRNVQILVQFTHSMIYLEISRDLPVKVVDDQGLVDIISQIRDKFHTNAVLAWFNVKFAFRDNEDRKSSAFNTQLVDGRFDSLMAVTDHVDISVEHGIIDADDLFAVTKSIMTFTAENMPTIALRSIQMYYDYYRGAQLKTEEVMEVLSQSIETPSSSAVNLVAQSMDFQLKYLPLLGSYYLARSYKHPHKSEMDVQFVVTHPSDMAILLEDLKVSGTLLPVLVLDLDMEIKSIQLVLPDLQSLFEIIRFPTTKLVVKIPWNKSPDEVLIKQFEQLFYASKLKRLDIIQENLGSYIVSRNMDRVFTFQKQDNMMKMNKE